MDMVQHILKGCQRICEAALNFLEEGMNFQEFEEELWETMHSVGRDILMVVLEAKDQKVREDEKRKETFETERPSPFFGDVTYRRTYCRSVHPSPGLLHWVQEEKAYRSPHGSFGP